MAQPEIKNHLPYQAGLLHLTDCDGVPVGVAVIKATFAIASNGLQLAEQQQPIFYAGVLNGEPGLSSYRYEPDCAYFKPATDVVLIANAIPPDGATTHLDVEFSVGPLRKRALVIGDRYWQKGFLGPRLTNPEPFQTMPLIYEKSFGGWDRSHKDPTRHSYEARNPVGRGFQSGFLPDQEEIPLPNIEDPDDLASSMGSRPTPAGFGFVSPDWQPRAGFAGTYDQTWTASRMPAVPLDFDSRFLNAGSQGLVAEGYLVGDEPVTVINCSPRGPLSFALPGIKLPTCLFRLLGRTRMTQPAQLDTVVVNTEEEIVTLTWRTHIRLPRGAEQLLRVRIY